MVGERTMPVATRSGLDEVMRSFPTILESLRTSYEELQTRARHVEDELCLANRELERKVRELDGLKRHLEAVLESLPCGVVVRGSDGTIVSVNRSAESILGVTAAELVGASDHASLAGSGADGQPHELTRADGSRLVLASSYSAVDLSDGTLDGSVEILDDHTERTEMVERLHAADKMAALGTMAAGIAHEIRNPLTAAKGFAALLGRSLHEEPETARWCKLIEDAVLEADAIIENMLSFGSPQRLRLETIDCEELLAGAMRLALADDEVQSSVSVCTSVSAPPFLGDRIKLRQAIRNLVENAIQAQSAGARVDVTLTLEEQEIVVRVADAGPGVPPEIRHRIFDPFYTDHAGGTGLGLALVAAIARLHGGTAQVSSEPSSTLGGAEFLIRFPNQPVDGPAPIPETPGAF